MNTPIVPLDESPGGVDTKSTNSLAEILKELSKLRITLIPMHAMCFEELGIKTIQFGELGKLRNHMVSLF